MIYIEPYGGGAGAALALLATRDVSSIVVNDLDPAIYSFWYSVVYMNADLQEMVSSVQVSVETWLEQREVYRRADATDPLALGFATLFLNRTSRSGVLGGGVIGGFNQSGKYRVGARYYRETLLDRLSTIRDLSSRIEVTQMDGADLFEERAQGSNSFFYIDPPYYEKGSSLYLNAFDHGDHMRLAESLNSHSDVRWVLTYDCAPQISEAYSDRRQCRFALRYSAHRTELAQELLIASDGVVVPGMRTRRKRRVGQT